MSPNPRQRIKNKAPSKNILDAAHDLRRLEVLFNLNLITEAEKAAEKKAVERYLGINRTPAQPAAQAAPVAPQPENSSPAPVQVTTTQPAVAAPVATPQTTVIVPQPVVQTAPAAPQPAPVQPAAPAEASPNVTSPF
jgi:hypothetical protein